MKWEEEGGGEKNEATFDLPGDSLLPETPPRPRI